MRRRRIVNPVPSPRHWLEDASGGGNLKQDWLPIVTGCVQLDVALLVDCKSAYMHRRAEAGLVDAYAERARLKLGRGFNTMFLVITGLKEVLEKLI